MVISKKKAVTSVTAKKLQNRLMTMAFSAALMRLNFGLWLLCRQNALRVQTSFVAHHELLMASDLATLAQRYAGGDETVLSEITPEIYDQLKAVARNHLRKEQAGHTLQATGVVNEAYERMADSPGFMQQSRAHFFRLASRVMRNLLVDHARLKNTDKRGGGQVMEPLDTTALQYQERCTQHIFGPRDSAETQVGLELNFLLLDDAMASLRRLNPRQAEVVDLRFFGGMSVEETAVTLDVSVATVKRDWTIARAFLQQLIEQARTES
jgi:RNA polymerase sigma factor (TIGR02999 family)